MPESFRLTLGQNSFMKQWTLVILLISAVSSVAQDSSVVKGTEVIYGRKDGMALTMMVFKPEKSNKRGIVSVVSGNWRSSFSRLEYFADIAKNYTDRGYTVFNVVHGSQPRYAIPDAVADIKRAVQFIRYNAAGYNIEADYIGIIGASSGGHLSLMAGLADNTGDPKATDPVSRVSGKVQAVACFFPPTDFLNWGVPGLSPTTQKAFLSRMGVLGAFTFTQYDSSRVFYTPVGDSAKFMGIAKAVSPAWLVTADDAPVLIWHGDKDVIVPLQQSKLLEQKMKSAGVPVVLKIKPGAGHGWPNIEEQEKDFADWFDRYLKPKK